MTRKLSGIPWHVSYLARERFENRLEAGYVMDGKKNDDNELELTFKCDKKAIRGRKTKNEIKPQNIRKKNGKATDKKAINKKIVQEKRDRGIYVEYGDKVGLYCIEENERIDIDIERSPAELSPVSKLCLGKKKNDIFKYKEFTYKIINIKPYR